MMECVWPKPSACYCRGAEDNGTTVVICGVWGMKILTAQRCFFAFLIFFHPVKFFISLTFFYFPSQFICFFIPFSELFSLLSSPSCFNISFCSSHGECFNSIQFNLSKMIFFHFTLGVIIMHKNMSFFCDQLIFLQLVMKAVTEN